MKRRGFLKCLGFAPLVAAAPAVALPHLWPKEDIAGPRTAVELAKAMDLLFTPYHTASIKAYEDISGKRYQHVTYALGKVVLDDRTEEVIVRSLWMTMLVMRNKYSAKPVIFWRQKPTYKQEYQSVIRFGFPDRRFGDLTGRVFTRFSLMVSSDADIGVDLFHNNPAATPEGSRIRVIS